VRGEQQSTEYLWVLSIARVRIISHLMSPDHSAAENETLFELATRLAGTDGTRDSDDYWHVIRRLHGRPDREVFEKAIACCGAASSAERLVGADVLAQVGSADAHGARPFTDETLPVLRAMLTDEEEDVVAAAIHALAHHRQAIVADLCELVHHGSRDIREAVAHALTGHDGADVIALLLELTADADDGVRDWATFAIGSQTDADAPRIRKALFDRLSDADEEVRGEAMVGLARRRDTGVIDRVAEALQSPNPLQLVFDAADQLLSAYPDDSRLTTALAKWRDH
jgi:HEAT repeat protein